MSVRTFFLIAAMVFYPSIALAAPVPVQSGEHDDFSRLVAELPAGDTEWQVEQNGDQIVLTFLQHSDGFDADRVFDFIPRDRIAQVSTGPDTLTLTLGCVCIATAFLERGAFVVIDIAAQGVTLVGKPIVSIPDEEPSDVSAKNNWRTPALALPVVPMRLRSDSVPLSFPNPGIAPRATLSADEQQVLADMQQKLARELGNAASRGVLTPVPGRAATRPKALETQEAEETIPPPEPEYMGPRSNIRISSSRDLPQGSESDDNMLTVGGKPCPPSDTLDVSSWGNDRPFAEQIGKAREGLFSELDRLDHDVATKLAQSYLFFGFGAEARQVLEMDPGLAAARRPLLIIADILDGRPAKNWSILSQAATCHPEVALWAALALPEPVAGAVPNIEASLRALNKLPPHLRQILAPALSQKLLAFGDEPSAALALRSLQRLPDPLPSAARLAQAEIKLQEGNLTEGTAQLEDVADDNTDQSPVALIALIDARIAADQPIAIDAANLVAAYAMELRETDLGPDLLRAHILALLKSGQFDEAFAKNARLGGDDASDAAQALRKRMLRELTNYADDIVFLDHVFAQPEENIAQLPPRDQATLAARFLALGFAERAERTLGHIPDRSLLPEQQILAARIALALEKPYRAQASLLGLNTEQAQRLRADAKRMVGAHDEAHELYTQTAQAAAAAEAGWLADDWQTLTTAETPVFGAASRLAQNTTPASDVNSGMLARTAAALDESVAARQALTNLLNEDALNIDSN